MEAALETATVDTPSGRVELATGTVETAFNTNETVLGGKVDPSCGKVEASFWSVEIACCTVEIGTDSEVRAAGTDEAASEVAWAVTTSLEVAFAIVVVAPPAVDPESRASTVEL